MVCSTVLRITKLLQAAFPGVQSPDWAQRFNFHQPCHVFHEEWLQKIAQALLHVGNVADLTLGAAEGMMLPGVAFAVVHCAFHLKGRDRCGVKQVMQDESFQKIKYKFLLFNQCLSSVRQGVAGLSLYRLKGSLLHGILLSGVVRNTCTIHLYSTILPLFFFL